MSTIEILHLIEEDRRRQADQAELIATFLRRNERRALSTGGAR